MKQIIVIDSRNDRGHGFMNKMMEDSAVPLNIMPIIKRLVEEGEDSEDIKNFAWPEKQMFPMDTVRDLILNHMYATAQESVPGNVVENIKGNLYNVLKSDSEDDSEISASIMQGSSKKYSKVFPDGTKVEITMSKSTTEDPLADIREQTEIAKQEKEARLQISNIDTIKAMTEISKYASFDKDLNKVVALFAKMAKEGNIKVANNGVISNIISEVVNRVKINKYSFLSKISEDAGTGYKEVIGDMAIDKRRLSEAPYDSEESARKALSNRAFEMLWDKVRGGLSLSKVKTFTEAAKGDPMLERISDDVLRSIKWREE